MAPTVEKSRALEGLRAVQEAMLAPAYPLNATAERMEIARLKGIYCSVSGQDESEVDLLVDFINGIVIVQNPHDPDALKRYIDELRRGL